MTNWQCYENFPDLSGAKLLSVDTETCDPNLEDKGPGALRGDGYICGFSVATDDGFKGYYPLRHSEGNLPDPAKAVRWLKDQMATDIPKVGANLLYDAEWLKIDLGVDLGGILYDVQVADPLIDENYSSYRLNVLAQRWLGQQKEESLLYKAGVDLLGIRPTGKTEEEQFDSVVKKAKASLFKLPAAYVGPYGEADALLPIQIFKLQEKVLHEKGLWPVFLLECDILRLLLAMRFQGIPVDLDRAAQARDDIQERYNDTMNQIKRRSGIMPEVWAAESVASVCDALGLPYLKTKKGQPSFEAEWLASQEHPIFDLILKARQFDRCGGTFIQSKIIDLAIKGRLYPSFWQVKGERGGTVSGRFASSQPNAQQFPARNEELAKMTRSCLVAEPGCKWLVSDIKAQEPRLTVHYASLLGLPMANVARDKYRNDPDTDYHAMVGEMTGFIEQYGYDKGRKMAKTINLGLAYGMGPKKYAEKYGKTIEEARALFNTYHNKMPFVRALSDRCESMVKQRGYLKTLLGRHCNFNLYGPTKWEEGVRPLRKEEAIKAFGLPVQQYFTYRAMNRLIQGGSADMIKKAMVDCWKAGYVPNLTVHDELDFAYIENEKQIKEISEIMINATPLEVPIKLDLEIGPNWGELEKVK